MMGLSETSWAWVCCHWEIFSYWEFPLTCDLIPSYAWWNSVVVSTKGWQIERLAFDLEMGQGPLLGFFTSSHGRRLAWGRPRSRRLRLCLCIDCHLLIHRLLSEVVESVAGWDTIQLIRNEQQLLFRRQNELQSRTAWRNEPQSTFCYPATTQLNALAEELHFSSY